MLPPPLAGDGMDLETSVYKYYYYYYYYHYHYYLCANAHATVDMWRSEDNLRVTPFLSVCELWELNSGPQICTASTIQP